MIQVVKNMLDYSVSGLGGINEINFNWTRASYNPVMSQTAYWQYGIEDPTSPIVTPDNTSYYVWFSGGLVSDGSSYGAGYATSPFYGEKGEIIPSENYVVNKSDPNETNNNYTFTISAFPGYTGGNVIVDNSTIIPFDQTTTYTFSSIASNHNITATFEESSDIAPLASFVSSFTGSLPITKTGAFVDTSSNNPTAWNWSFGDGSNNVTSKNSSHKWTKRGLWSVILTVSNTAGSNSTYQNVRVING